MTRSLQSPEHRVRPERVAAREVTHRHGPHVGPPGSPPATPASLARKGEPCSSPNSSPVGRIRCRALGASRLSRGGRKCVPPLPCGALLALLCLLPLPLSGQQLVTDDAAIVAARACQVEAWHGAVESWVRPACQLVNRLEAEIGVGWIDHGASREMHGAVQLTMLVREMSGGRTGVAIVAGVESELPFRRPSAPELIYAHVPLSPRSPTSVW
jgi:hypothetical protein